MELFVRETSGEYRAATLSEINAAGLKAAKLKKGQMISIQSASNLIVHLGLTMRHLPEEQLRVILVDNSNRIIKELVMSEGLEDQTAVYPRKVMKAALLNHATGIVVAHNHPTGQLRPSNADLAITRELVKAAEALDLRFLDHVIIGDEELGYFSFRENGFI